MAGRFASVVLVHPALSHLDRPFTYALPDGGSLAPGALVRVPFRGRNRPGVIVELTDEASVEEPLEVGIALGPGLNPEILALARWVADRYLSTLGEALAAAVPERVASEERAVPAPAPLPPPPAGGAAPEAAAIVRAVGRRASFVWRPAAGADRGATIVALVSAALARGRGALVLVPEVRIGGEVAHSLASLGETVARLGSDRPARERYRDWLALRSGAKRVAVGGRSSVLAPVPDLGLVVVDDEGHASYKEGRAPRFHARAVAAERARRAGATLVLTGVPPSMEARTAAEGGGFTLVAPSRGAERAARPPVTIVDRTKEDSRLVPAQRTLALGKRALATGRVLILGHRGGRDVAAVAARATRALGARSPALLDARAGAADVERALRGADLIVATPFIAKDLDAGSVALLVLVDVDAALAQPEFRAAEETFSTWWRAARWVEGGRVVVETKDPRHPAIAALARWDPDVLWRAESARREELGYPPFAALARIDVPAERAAGVADSIASAAPGVEVLGPVERAEHHVVVVRARRRETLVAALRPLVDRWRAAGEPMRVDVDPREVLVPKWRS